MFGIKEVTDEDWEKFKKIFPIGFEFDFYFIKAIVTGYVEIIEEKVKYVEVKAEGLEEDGVFNVIYCQELPFWSKHFAGLKALEKVND